MRKISVLVTINLGGKGNIDAPHIMSAVDHAVNKAIAEGVITSDDTNHATVVSYTAELVDDPGDDLCAKAEDDNPFDPESPEGRAWEDGDRSAIEP